jgi:hypothetical protein
VTPIHTVWQLPLAEAGLVVLRVHATAGSGAAAATGAAAANQHVQSLRRSKVCCVLCQQKPPSAIKGSQGFPKAAGRGTLAAEPLGKGYRPCFQVELPRALAR